MDTRISDIAVIGGGVIGLALARALAREGASVAVFDAGGAIPPASRAAAGMLSPAFELGEGATPMQAALHEFAAHSLSLWPEYAAEIEAETAVAIDFKRDGALGIAFEEAQATQLRARAARIAAPGGGAQMITGDEARAMEPALSGDVIAALYSPDDAQVDPRLLLRALRVSLGGLGVAMIDARIVGVDNEARGYRLTAASGEAFDAARVVLAGGAVSGLVAQDIVFPIKGEAFSAALEEGVLTRVIRSPGAYLCPKAGGRLVIGATELRGEHGPEVNPQAIAMLKERAIIAVPEVAGAQELERWSGLRPGVRDRAPILGADRDGRFLALGHYRHGILHTPAATQAMAGLILGRAPDRQSAAALDAFTPARLLGG